MIAEAFLLGLLAISCVQAQNPSWGDHLVDMGYENYTCDKVLMAPSLSIPTNVNSVRPADIKLVMSLGDSLTAGNGAGAEDPLAIVLQYRGLSFQSGGDKGLEKHVTIPNILQKYNPNLFGQSNGIGSVNVWEVTHLNAAVPGARAPHLPSQAHDLINKLTTHKEINMEEDWKLLNIFIGGNDVCGYCRDPVGRAPDKFAGYIADAIRIIKQNVPRVIVSLTTMLHLEMVRSIDKGEGFCDYLHLAECRCEADKNLTDAEMSEVCTKYQKAEQLLQDSGEFEADDFTLVVQPFFNDITTPPMKDGKPDLRFFAPDCFHFAQYGHAMVSTWVWKNILEPVGAKTTKGDLSNPAFPLACPDPKCPFVRTTKNSANCAAYMTPAASN
ncbi:hypothetical protein QR680_001938 [Steinernema hermaphroditum]|uniref:Lipase_GDSL domain-containing protein n=1 Tax=Steinernema hermaphroditum TaxID=289476 RepID=A0AA39H0K9_9BILA|nr:hypothetical protein QR680_001938 [Steinernema hermaphroditum]